MQVGLIACTYKRHSCSERMLRWYLDQTYTERSTLLIYNNSEIKESIPEQVLASLPENKKIILINNNIDRETGRIYTNTGAIFRDALSFLPECDVVTHFDVDDIFLPTHISEGVKGMIKAMALGKKAYKPYFSWYLDSLGVTQVHNTLEPSFFILYSYLKEKGYKLTSVDYNQGWEDPLRDNDDVLIDRKGVPTFIYDWSGKTGVHKLSGGNNDQKNFDNHRVYSGDVGDGVIFPISEEAAQKYYSLIG
jgi:hypothetical protein